MVLSGEAKEGHLVSNPRALDVELGVAGLERLAGLAEDCWKTRNALEWN